MYHFFKRERGIALRLNRFNIIGVFALLLVISALITIGPVAKQESVLAVTDTDWKNVDTAMGRTGALLPGDVYKFSMPRSDLKVTIGRVRVMPALALGSWAAFKNTSSGSMVMGDLVLTEAEVGPVMQKLQAGGIEQTGLHNHLLGESPRVMYMHIAGHGDPVKMASTIHDALSLTGTPSGAPAVSPPADSSLDTAILDSTIGAKGKYNGGVYQFNIPRAEKITDIGMEIPPTMGVAMPLNFQPLGNGKAAITGDFVLTGNEVNPVIRALKNNGINVTAVHNHMLTEEPRLFFLHFWAVDDSGMLARGLRAALDETNIARAG
jgi:hypothetical protein